MSAETVTAVKSVDVLDQDCNSIIHAADVPAAVTAKPAKTRLSISTACPKYQEVMRVTVLGDAATADGCPAHVGLQICHGGVMILTPYMSPADSRKLAATLARAADVAEGKDGAA